jgi:hypothetical protein
VKGRPLYLVRARRNMPDPDPDLQPVSLPPVIVDGQPHIPRIGSGRGGPEDRIPPLD